MSNPLQLQIEREIVNMLESSIEDTRVPDAIAAYADKRAGKPVTVKDAQQLEVQLGVLVQITKRYGMTQIRWARGKAPNLWSDEGCILLAHGDTNVRWPTGDELRKREPAWFAARDERNEARRQRLQEHRIVRDALGSGVVADIDKSYILQAADAIIKLREAHAALQGLIDYDRPLYVIGYAIEKLAGDE